MVTAVTSDPHLTLSCWLELFMVCKSVCSEGDCSLLVDIEQYDCKYLAVIKNILKKRGGSENEIVKVEIYPKVLCK